MVYTLEELKERIKDKYDPDEFVEILNISTEMLVEAFEDLIIEKRWRFDEIEYEREENEEEGW